MIIAHIQFSQYYLMGNIYHIICHCSGPHTLSNSPILFNVSMKTVMIYVNMYHFDTSDQREKPVYISHIALALEC